METIPIKYEYQSLFTITKLMGIDILDMIMMGNSSGYWRKIISRVKMGHPQISTVQYKEIRKMTATCDNLWDFGVAYSRTHPDTCAHRPKPLDLSRFKAQNPKKNIVEWSSFQWFGFVGKVYRNPAFDTKCLKFRILTNMGPNTGHIQVATWSKWNGTPCVRFHVNLGIIKIIESI